MSLLQISALLVLASAALLPKGAGQAVSMTPDKLLPSVSLHTRGSREKRAALVMNQPIRVFPYYADNLNTILGDKASLVRNTIIPELLTFLSEVMSVAPVSGPILINNQCSNGGGFFRDNGMVYCAHQCEPVTQCGPFTVPTQHLKQCLQCSTGTFGNQCSSGSPSSNGSGVTGYDFLLYVSADQSACPVSPAGAAQVVAFASSCQHEDMQDRPVAGVVNFCPDGLRDRNEEFAFALTKHEVLHALVMARSLFALWRDADNNPRTARLSTGQPPIDTTTGAFTISTSTIRNVLYSDWLTRNGRISHTVTQLVTPAIQREARRHFGCNSLDGVELENQGGTGTALNHFEKRVLGNEAMTGQLTFNPVFSRFTFAAMEDSGWYTVNYSMAQPLVWGRGAGCRFAQGSCGEWIQTKTSSNQPLTPFCNEVFNSARLSCTVDREAVSKCDLTTYQSISAQFQYFSDAVTGGLVQIADFCGIQDVFQINEGGGQIRGTVCSVASNAPSSNSLLESYGQGSRCVNHGRQWTASSQFISNYGSGCYQYSCTDTSVAITIAGTDIICGCSQTNQEMTFVRTVNGVQYTGSILCPSCDVICEVSSNKIISTGSGNSNNGGGDGGQNGIRDETAAVVMVLTVALLAGLILS